MSTDPAVSAIPLSVLSDAGAWLVRLSGPLRTPTTEEGFQKWLRENPLHSVAFRQVSAEWDEADRLKRYTDVVIRVPGSSRNPKISGNKPANGRFLFAAAALAMVAVGGLVYYLRPASIETGINELRVVTLEDGTKLHLNTSTRITVAYGKTERRVQLDSGEALFEVAKHPAWPFVVDAGTQQVRALGTAFLIRRETQRLSVTLVEGKVAVSPVSESLPSSIRAAQSVNGPNGAPYDQKSAGPTRGDLVVLAPGQRATWNRQKAPTLDRPQVNKLLAWQQGKVAIDNLPLAAAVGEMNRYSSVQLVLAQPQPEELLVSGVFTAGQSMSFARAMAQSYGLEVINRGGSIELAGIGRSVVKSTTPSNP